MPKPDASPLLKLSPKDNVCVLVRSVQAGERLEIDGQVVTLAVNLSLGHKIAARAIQAGERIIKYGAPIGSATRDIALGEHVHLHNMKSDYIPTYTLDQEHSYVRDA